MLVSFPTLVGCEKNASLLPGNIGSCVGRGGGSTSPSSLCKSAQQQLLGQRPSSSCHRGVLRALQHKKSVGSETSGFSFLCKAVGLFPQLAVMMEGSIKTPWV